MSAPFATHAWVEALASATQDSDRVAAEAKTWVFGPMLLVVEADAEHGVEASAFRIDLHDGAVRAVEPASVDDVARSPFVLRGTLAHWKAILAGQVGVVDAILDSKLEFDGDLPTVARHRGLFDAIVAAGGTVDTTWQDEQEPVASA